MGRSAPEGGYDFGRKQHYRRIIWSTFRKQAGSNRSKAVCMLMPSSEGTEIEVALQNGFREENLVVVDRNPAIVAHLKRRFPRIRTYGVPLRKAADRILHDGILPDFANLDLCSNLGRSSLREIQHVSFKLFRPGAVVAVNCLRGREKGDVWKAINMVPTIDVDTPRNDQARITMLSLAVAFVDMDDGPQGLYAHTMCEPEDYMMPYLLRHGTYVSTNGQSMLWCVFKMLTWEEAMRVRPIYRLSDPL